MIQTLLCDFGCRRTFPEFCPPDPPVTLGCVDRGGCKEMVVDTVALVWVVGLEVELGLALLLLLLEVGKGVDVTPV